MCLWELAKNFEAQTKLVDEISKFNSTKLIKLQNRRYLDLLINETSRKSPPLPSLMRVCNKNCSLTTNERETFKFLRGDLIEIPIKLMQNDEKYFHKPENFDSLRFANNENYEKFLSFGKGPRQCIAKEFSMLQIKAFIVTLLSEYSVEILNNSNVISKNDKKLVFVQRICDKSHRQ